MSDKKIEKLRESYDDLEKAQKEILKLIQQFELKDKEWYDERLLSVFLSYLRENNIDISGIDSREHRKIVLEFIVYKRDSNTDWGRTWCHETISLMKSDFNDKFGDMLDAKLAFLEEKSP